MPATTRAPEGVRATSLTAASVPPSSLRDEADTAALEPGWRIAGRQAFALFVLAFAVVRACAVYANTVENGGDPWMAGDWLINYADGFVRRGLFGEVFLAWAPAGDAGLWTLFAIQVGLYAVMLGHLIAFLHRQRWSWSSIALVCGPAGIAFIGWDVFGGFRKEILAFVALALFSWATWTRRTAAVVALTLAGASVYAFSVFSWESTAQLIPAVWFLLLAGRGRALPALRWSAAAATTVAAGFGALLNVLFHGDAGTAIVICRRVRDAGFLGPNLCGAADFAGGGIEAIGWTAAKTLGEVGAAYPLYIGYFPLIALSLVPVLVSRWFRAHWVWALALAAAVLPLYFVVTDYGRWTHVLVMALTFCVTANDGSGVYSALWNPIVAVLYVTMWGMPHNVALEETFAWSGLVATLVRDGIVLGNELLDFPRHPGLSRGGP